MIPSYLKKKSFWPIEELLMVYKPLVIVKNYPFACEDLTVFFITLT